MVYADPLFDKDSKPVEGQYRLRQLPEVSGAMVAMDPWTGRVLAMVGGFWFDQRPVQPRHASVSAAGLVVQAAGLFGGDGQWLHAVDRRGRRADRNRSGAGRRRLAPGRLFVGRIPGPVTLRNALKNSLNTVTVRLAQDIGMPLIGEYSKRFGVYDDLPNYLSYALGAGETTVMRMVTAYSMFANGGRRVKPTLIDRIQDRYGHTIFKHDARECRGCDAPAVGETSPSRNSSIVASRCSIR